MIHFCVTFVVGIGPCYGLWIASLIFWHSNPHYWIIWVIFNIFFIVILTILCSHQSLKDTTNFKKILNHLQPFLIQNFKIYFIQDSTSTLDCSNTAFGPSNILHISSEGPVGFSTARSAKFGPPSCAKSPYWFCSRSLGRGSTRGHHRQIKTLRRATQTVQKKCKNRNVPKKRWSIVENANGVIELQSPMREFGAYAYPCFFLTWSFPINARLLRPFGVYVFFRWYNPNFN